MINDIVQYLTSGAVIGGIIVAWLQSQVKQAKAEKEKREAERVANEKEYRRLVNDYQHATGRLFFWTHKGLRLRDKEHVFFNGDFEKSYEDFIKAEDALKEFEQKIFIQQNY